MTDIVHRLRDPVNNWNSGGRFEAADEIERLRADLAAINKIANIPPAEDQYGSLAVRMEKIWLLSRGNEQTITEK